MTTRGASRACGLIPHSALRCQDATIRAPTVRGGTEPPVTNLSHALIVAPWSRSDGGRCTRAISECRSDFRFGNISLPPDKLWLRLRRAVIDRADAQPTPTSTSSTVLLEFARRPPFTVRSALPGVRT